MDDRPRPRPARPPRTGAARRPPVHVLEARLLAAVVVAGVGGGGLPRGVSTARASRTPLELRCSEHGERRDRGAGRADARPIKPPPTGPGTASSPSTADEETAIGFHFAKVEAQTEPIKLELTGRTAYDPNTLTKIRPRFDTLVEKVYATLGQKVKKGDPLVDLYSTDLAAGQERLPDQVRPVAARPEALRPPQEAGRDRRDLAAALGRHPERRAEEPARLQPRPRQAHGLLRGPRGGDRPAARSGSATRPIDARQFGNVADKAKMTLRAKADGIVIEREVVPGNYYETPTS